VSPLFKPISHIRNVLDWFPTLPGCARCNYVTLAPTMIVAVLFGRHAKAFYLAIDHYFFHEDDETF
jgi:hypothetical protein